MSFTIETVTFSNEKHCFIGLSEGSKFKDSQDVQVFEIDADGQPAYVSWSGETIRSKQGTLQINRQFAEKLGIKEKDEVTLKPLSKVPVCSKSVVVPVSADDWEILDRHTSFLETRLLDQIRVIQLGVTYPFWVNKTTCVYIKIVDIVPANDCVVLANETEIHLAPKVRASVNEHHMIEQPMKSSVTNHLNTPFIKDSPLTDEDIYEPRFASTDSTDSDFGLAGSALIRKKMKQDRMPIPFSNISNHWHALRGVFSYLGLMEKTIMSDSEDEDLDESDYHQPSSNVLANGLNLVLRVQHMLYTPSDHDTLYTEPVVRRGSQSPRKNGSISPRKSPSKSMKTSLTKSGFRMNFFPQQPSTIYVDLSDIEKQVKCNRSDIPCEFFAKLRKLPSPKDQQQEKQQQQQPSTSAKRQGQNGKDHKSKDKNGQAGSSGDTPCTDTECNSGDSGGICVVVRVLVIDHRRHLCSDKYSAIIKRVLEEQPLLKGHVIIPDMLRRTLKLDVTSRVWIQTFKGSATQANNFSIYPLGNVPKRVTSDMMSVGFRQWLNQVSSEDYPMVVFQGFFVRFPVLPDELVEAQITYNEQNNSVRGCYTFLHPGILRSASLSIVSGGRSADITNPAIQPMLAYTSMSSIDPVVPRNRLIDLGGISGLIQEALLNIEICLGSRPMNKQVFRTTPGLLNGMLLLTGPKGSGKTNLARALCRSVAELPNLAYTVVVDCKPLRGKKIDSILRIFEMVFDEAAWRQPALIVLDDLDHIAGSPAGPEFELSSEALYSARVAEVVKDLLRKDIRNLTNIAVMATSISRTSLHPILVSSRGTHLVQEVLTINPPNVAERKDILQLLMETKSTLSDDNYMEVDLEALSQKMEGYVAKDLEKIISRAIHAHILCQGRGADTDDKVTLSQEDFETALVGFTPASIRNVPLHQSGDLGWDDIGGLTGVKETLVETLQWPTKYPALFASCPLRLRSGLLLYGAPGTGKTLLAGVVAKECGLNFISIKGPEMLSKYIGASEQAVRDIFVRAQSAKPCILFFDEFDSIAPRRGHDNTGVTDRVVNQLLTQLDGVEGLEGVYVLAATSRPDLIDPALLRPGRLDKCLHCEIPNESERLNILKALSRRMSFEEGVDFKHFAKICVDYTGADFKALLYNAQLEAIHEYTSQDSSPGSAGESKVSKASNKLKSRGHPHLKVNVKTSHRHSLAGRQYAYIPNLEDGVVQVSQEMEEKLSTQLNQIYERERRTSVVNELPDSPIIANKVLRVKQDHLLQAASKMRPSVSGVEKQKYHRIYQSFVSSKGANFDAGLADEIKQLKATLA